MLRITAEVPLPETISPSDKAADLHILCLGNRNLPQPGPLPLALAASARSAPPGEPPQDEADANSSKPRGPTFPLTAAGRGSTFTSASA